MYFVQVDGYIYAQPRTLVSAMRDVYGCGNAHILRARRNADGETEYVKVVEHAGRAFTDLVHAPSGQKVYRNRSRRYVGLTPRSRGYWEPKRVAAHLAVLVRPEHQLPAERRADAALLAS